MAGKLLLVGSIPLDTPAEVFNAFAPALGPWLDYLPDGEVGERRYWIDGLAYRVLNGHPELETLARPAPDADGVEQWRPQGLHDQFRFRVKDGVETVRFGDPGWRLGYTRDAVNSYFVFRQLKKDGVIPSHVRFQVCMPLSYSAVTSFFPDADDHARILPGITRALTAEVEEMVRQIPPGELAIQWDLAVENRHLEPVLAEGGVDAAKEIAARMAAPAAEICAAIPPEVALGYHSCYGTLDGWPGRQPPDVTGSVLLLNACIEASGRRVEFLHMPTLAAATADYFAPLRDLKVGDGRLYLGAIHHMHGADGLKAQIEAVGAHISDFGLAAPCGFGRAPERPGHLLGAEGRSDVIKGVLADHRRAAEMLG